MRKRKLLTLLAAAFVMLALTAAPVMADLIADATLDFNANDSASGVSSSSWVSLTADQSRNWSPGGDVSLVDASGGFMSKAYRFTGGSGADASSWTNYDEAADATWELWVKPAGTGSANNQIIFESGGGGTGMAIYYDKSASTINFLIDSGTPVRTVSGQVDTTEFSHVVCVYDKDLNGNDLMQIWVNGVLADEVHDINNLDKWSGTDGAGLGHVNSGVGSNISAGSFYGDLAVLRFWEAKALTTAEVEGNYALYVSSGPEIIRPENGAVVAPGEVPFEWINLDPNGATETYVDVWFGTDPNKVTGPDAGTYTKVVNGESISSFALTPDGPGVYYWQVDSYTHGKPTTAGGTVDYSSGDPCMIEGRVNMFTNDAPIESVDAGADTITWSGESVQLTPDVIDDDSSALTYAWTMGPLPAGVEVAIDPSLDVAAPSITFTKAPYANAGIINAGFEDPVVADGVNNGTTPTGWTKTGSSGIADAALGGIIDIVEEGEQCAWANPEGTLSTVLSETVQAGATYTLSVGIGYGQWSNGAKYQVQLIALDGENELVLAEDDNSNPPTALQSWSTSIVSYTNDPVADANKVDLPLMIKLVNPADSPGGADVEFDNVVLTSDTLFPVSEDVSSVDLTLTVNDASNPTVSDSMTIDVYLNACQAAQVGLGLDLDTDYDGSCLVDVADLATMAGQWLDDPSATEAQVNPTQPGTDIITNGGFTFYKPGTDYTVTALFNATDGFVNGVGDNLAVSANDDVDYSDGTTGVLVDIPGWVNAEGTTPQFYKNMGIEGTTALTVFAAWNRNGGRAESAENLGYIQASSTYTLSAKASGGIFGDVNLVTRFELLVDGAAITPSTPLNATVSTASGEYQDISVTYDEAALTDYIGKPFKVLVGTGPSPDATKAGRGWIDDVKLDVTVNDATVPSVDAGADMVTWLGEPVQLAPIVEPNELLDPQPVLVYNWTAETVDGLDVVISDPAVEAPTVTVTRVAPSDVESVNLILSVNNEGSSTAVTDFMKIDVYETACDVTKAVDPSAIDDTDHNIDCTTNLIDFAVLAADWLGDYSLTGPVAK